MNKAELVERATALGIDVDGRWSNERLQQEIQQKEAAQANNEAGSATENATPAPVVSDPDAPPPEVVGVTPGPTPTSLVKSEPPKANEKKAKVVLKVDYWPEEDKRIKAGETIELPVSKAREMILAQKAEQPLPEAE
jgi:hypothetical protein